MLLTLPRVPCMKRTANTSCTSRYSEYLESRAVVFNVSLPASDLADKAGATNDALISKFPARIKFLR